jgi:hypothetical protein
MEQGVVRGFKGQRGSLALTHHLRIAAVSVREVAANRLRGHSGDRNATLMTVVRGGSSDGRAGQG